MLEELLTSQFIILACLCFIGAFIDSVAGGGGLISLPAYLASGLPPHIALGTNKLSSFFSGVGSSVNYARSGKVNWNLMKKLAPFSFVGAFIGVKLIIGTKPQYINYIVFTALIVVLAYTLTNKKMGHESTFTDLNKSNITKGMIMALIIGFYNGFLGPGTGSFLVFFLMKIYGYDFVEANGDSKILNLVGNFTSLLVFGISGKVYFLYGIPISIIMLLGAQCGSRCAISKGSKFIKPVFLIVTTVTALKMLKEMF
ncbi:TSUP family transporter [Fusobacterium varium]|uniref:sulfite exporter TauE/SafE family protein n=1 Tax=Fusobacterium TaxID=848 RepID=UPI001032CD52|nr:TSUP family transporter [Fusobacterium ulcerans]